MVCSVWLHWTGCALHGSVPRVRAPQMKNKMTQHLTGYESVSALQLLAGGCGGWPGPRFGR